LNYEPLIERDLDAIAPAAHAFLASHAPEELWTSVTRFAVLAYAPSQHAKRAVLACRAAYDVRGVMGERWVELIIACAKYAAASRPPWSEPPILEPPPPSNANVEELRSGDRLRGDRWLSAVLDHAEVALRDIVRGDARLMLDAATALLPHLGERGRFALFRMPVAELVAEPDARDEDAPIETLIERAADGSIDAVRDVFVALAMRPAVREAQPPLAPYDLARDYAQTLIAHAFACRLPRAQADALLHAVHRNLDEGESYAAWSFA
jgi:hypothetical protein